jgi:hypothetical protein
LADPRASKDKFYQLLSLAERHVAEAAQVIQQQEQLIVKMRDDGQDTELAESLLEKLRTAARAMAKHQKSIETQIRLWEDEQA